MSNLIVPDVGKVPLLAQTVGQNPGPPSWVKLFKTLIVPGPGITVADLTEADFTGYLSQLLNNVSVAPALDAGARAVASWDAQTYTKLGATGNDIYGYWVENFSGDLIYFEQFDQIVPMQADGAQLVMNPKFTGRSQFSNI